MENVWRFLKKLRIELLYNPETLLGIYVKNLKTFIYSQQYMHPMFTATLFMVPRHGDKVSFHRGLDKDDVVRMYCE